MDKKIQAAVTLNGKDKTVTFATTGVEVKEQSVVFKSGFQVRGFSVSSFLFHSQKQEAECLLAVFHRRKAVDVSPGRCVCWSLREH